MNIYETDVRPSLFDPGILVARCPKCDNLLLMIGEHVVCDKCGEDVFVVAED